MKKFAGILIVSLVLIGGSALPAEAKTKKKVSATLAPIVCIQYPPRPGIFYPAVCQIGKPPVFRF